MPLYEYSCGACGAVSEINHRMSDPVPTDCPHCSAPQLSKLISAAGFRLKGDGWYETDFKSAGKKNLAGDAGASAPAPSAEAKTSTAAAESKPAAAASAAPSSAAP